MPFDFNQQWTIGEAILNLFSVMFPCEILFSAKYTSKQRKAFLVAGKKKKEVKHSAGPSVSDLLNLLTQNTFKSHTFGKKWFPKFN